MYSFKAVLVDDFCFYCFRENHFANVGKMVFFFASGTYFEYSISTTMRSSVRTYSGGFRVPYSQF